MKRFIHFTLVLALILGFVSCKKDEILNTAKETTKDAPVVKNLPPKQKITLSASSNKPGLRVKYDASKGEEVTDDNTLWQEGDQIAVYNVGVNGSPALFTLVDGAGTSDGTFEGEIEPTGNYYGIYPISVAGPLDGTSIDITLPLTQNYAENSFGQNAAIFAATSTTEESKVVLHFEPLLGYLSLSLTTLPNTTRDADSRVGMHTVGSIVLHANSLGQESLSGATTVDMSSDKPQLVSAPTGGGLNVTLNCPSVELSPTEPKEFIIAVPAGVFKKGLCATVKDPSGKKIISFATTTPNVTEVNYITKLPTQPVFNIEDVEGNRYPVAKIGSYFWTAENLRSTVYDNHSERAGATIEKTPAVMLNNPFYVDPTDKTLWTDDQNHYMDNPSDYNEVCSQLSRWGYLYNWAAALGYATGTEATSESGFIEYERQGICPDGWHVPSFQNEYWLILSEYVGNGLEDQYYSIYVSGTFLKTVEGWSSTPASAWDPYDEGTDDFGFSALPVGHFSVSSDGSTGYMSEIGGYADLITSSQEDETSLWVVWLCNYTNQFRYAYAELKQDCRAVRCMKNY